MELNTGAKGSIISSATWFIPRKSQLKTPKKWKISQVAMCYISH